MGSVYEGAGSRPSLNPAFNLCNCTLDRTLSDPSGLRSVWLRQVARGRGAGVTRQALPKKIFSVCFSLLRQNTQCLQFKGEKIYLYFGSRFQRSSPWSAGSKANTSRWQGLVEESHSLHSSQEAEQEGKTLRGRG